MNRTRIQYAVIAHRELTEAKRQIAVWESQLTDRLAALDSEEKSEYVNRLRPIAEILLDGRLSSCGQETARLPQDFV